MGEELHTAELIPEFAAIQEQVRQFSLSQAQDDVPTVDVPEPRSEVDTTTQAPTDRADGPMYLRHVGAVEAGLCSPLSAYLHKVTETTNPRRFRRDEGLNLVALVVQAGRRLNPAVRRYLRDWRLGDLDDARTRLMAKAQAEAVNPAHGLERLLEADRQAIIERFRGGSTREQLAEEYDVSLSTVKRLLRKAGVRRRDWPKRSA